MNNGARSRSPEAQVNDARIVAVPIADNHTLMALYLTPNPAVDDLIASGTWTAYTTP